MGCVTNFARLLLLVHDYSVLCVSNAIGREKTRGDAAGQYVNGSMGLMDITRNSTRGHGKYHPNCGQIRKKAQKVYARSDFS